MRAQAMPGVGASYPVGQRRAQRMPDVLGSTPSGRAGPGPGSAQLGAMRPTPAGTRLEGRNSRGHPHPSSPPHERPRRGLPVSRALAHAAPHRLRRDSRGRAAPRGSGGAHRAAAAAAAALRPARHAGALLAGPPELGGRSGVLRRQSCRALGAAGAGRRGRSCARRSRACSHSPSTGERPLWEMHLLEGLADGRTALFQKVHHCMIDGVAGAQMLETLLDAEPKPPPRAAIGLRYQAELPDASQRFARALGEEIATRARDVASVWRAVTPPARGVGLDAPASRRGVLGAAARDQRAGGAALERAARAAARRRVHEASDAGRARHPRAPWRQRERRGARDAGRRAQALARGAMGATRAASS